MTDIELLKRCEKWLRYQVLGFTKEEEAEQLALLSDLVAAIAREPKVVKDSILGSLKPPFMAYRLHSNDGYYITDGHGDTVDIVLACDILNDLTRKLKEAEND